jgi:hypothetical protein
MSHKEKQLRNTLRRMEGMKKRGELFGNKYLEVSELCQKFLMLRPTVEELYRAVEPFGVEGSEEYRKNLLDLGYAKIKDGQFLSFIDWDVFPDLEVKKRHEIMRELIKSRAK